MAIERLKLSLAIFFFDFRKIDIEDSLEESLHRISGCLYRWTLCPCCAKCWWVMYNAYIFKMWQFALDFLLAALLDVNRKNTINLSLFKHVSQELLMVFWKKVKRMNGGVYQRFIQLKLWRTLNNLTLNIWLKGFVLLNILQVYLSRITDTLSFNFPGCSFCQ